MKWLRRCTILVALFLVVCLAAWLIPSLLDPTDSGPARRARDRTWVNTSPYFWDRQACRWIGVCGLHHLRRDPASRSDGPPDAALDKGAYQRLELRRRDPPLSWESPGAGCPRRQDKRRGVHERRRLLKPVPDFVLRHAPLVHLYSGEDFWPSDIREHVQHMTVYADGEPLNATDEPWTLHNLQQLNALEGRVILHSDDDVESRPDWLHSHFNAPTPFDDPEDDEGGDGDGDGDGPRAGLPPPPPPRSPFEHRESSTWWDVDRQHPLHRISDPRGRSHPPKHQSPRLTARGQKPDSQGYSKAPAVLVLVDKGSGVLDAFWFFFYSYNLGQTVLGIRFGNHVGDWEHCMVRFEHGQPRGVYFSEHDGGQSYTWQAVEKRGDRPVIYSAVGSHAMYPLPGVHPYVLPFQMLRDVTDKGPLWDPALNNYAYHYDYDVEYVEDEQEHEPDTRAVRDPQSLVPAASNPDAPTSWFHYRGAWGDDVYSLADPRQWRLFGQYHYVLGPYGPKFKYLARSKMCQLNRCKINYEPNPKGTWY